jgi:1-acyl-sn-glycerol-3-phosphate acyltransferase
VTDFRPPRANTFLTNFAKLIVWPIALGYNRYHKVNIDDDDLARLKALDGKRTIICSNHSHRHDPAFLFSLSKIMHEEFNYVAAREIFDRWHGIFGWCLQRGGVYSVTRGVLDRASIATSKDIICRGEKKLVVFPECEVSGSPDRLLPLEQGLVSLFYRATEDVRRTAPHEPVYIVPLALKYRYLKDTTSKTKKALSKVEHSLGLPTGNELTPIQRFRRASVAVAMSIESEYELESAAGISDEERMTRAVYGLLKYISETLHVDLSEPEDVLNAVHALRNRVHIMIASREKSNRSRYATKLHRENASSLTRLPLALERLVRLHALRDFLSATSFTEEGLVGAVELLEREVYGTVIQKGPRNVYIKVGQPIDLMQRYALYETNRRKEINTLTAMIENQLRKLLLLPTEPRIAVPGKASKAI